jgi:hypothetical protein
MPFIQLQFRRDTSTNWTSNNPLLADGEMGIETDTQLFKIGTGLSVWTLLPYGGIHGPTGATGQNGSNGVRGATGENGTNGVTGATGQNGSNGVTGPTGQNGTNGVTGATGQNGSNGAIGPTGPTGATGQNGSNGAIGATGENGSNGAVGPTGPTGDNPTAVCASAYSTASQTVATNVSENLQHDVVDFAYGITVTTGPTGYFQVPSAGVYKIIPSLQVTGTNNGNIHVWIKKDGANVANTTTYMTFKNGDRHVLTTEILLELLANERVQIWTQASVTGGVIEYIAAGGAGANSYPAAPGIITNMYKIR